MLESWYPTPPPTTFMHEFVRNTSLSVLFLIHDQSWGILVWINFWAVAAFHGADFLSKKLSWWQSSWNVCMVPFSYITREEPCLQFSFITLLDKTGSSLWHFSTFLLPFIDKFSHCCNIWAPLAGSPWLFLWLSMKLPPLPQHGHRGKCFPHLRLLTASNQD